MSVRKDISNSEIEEQYDKVYRYCYYRLRQRELAEDITQEVFLRFFQKEQYQTEKCPMKIMYTIARNLCIDECRRKKPLSIEDVGGEMEESGCGGIEDDILLRGTLRDAMAKLSEEEREIVFLRVVNVEPLSVVGNLFHISRYAVYRRCEHALQELRRELGVNSSG